MTATNSSEQGGEVEIWIVCAANRLRESGRIVCGARHFDAVMRAQMVASEGIDVWKRSEQGFIDQRGTFRTRAEAHAIANKNGQIRRRCGGDDGHLYSENLY